MKVETICSICLAILSVISLLLTFIKSWRYKKRQAILATTAGDTTNAVPENDNDIDELNKKIKIFSKVIGYICEAEKVFAGVKNPMAKLNYVITKTQIDAVKNNLTIDDNDIVNYVEEVLETPQKKSAVIKQENQTQEVKEDETPRTRTDIEE